MKRHFCIALVSIAIFTLVNLLAAIFNESKGFPRPGGIQDVSASIIFVSIVGFFYFLTSFVNVGLSETVKLPLIRIVFWLIIALPVFTSSPRALASGDFIYAAVLPSHLWISTLFSTISEYGFLSNGKIKLAGIIILGVSIFQFFVFQLSTIIINKLTTYNSV